MKKLLVILAFLAVYASGYSSRETFDDYSFLLNFYGNIGLGGPSGPIMDQERNSYTLTATYEDGTVQSANPFVWPVNWGLSGEFLIGHFGFELSYNPIYITENASVGGNDNYQSYSYGGNLISGDAIYAGINYHVPFNFRRGCGSLYFGVKGGYLTGTLNPYVSFVDFANTEEGAGISQPSISLTGYSIVPHIGVDFMLDVFTFGMSLSYFIDNFTASQNLNTYYTYSGKNFSVDYLTIDFSIGIAF